MPCIDPAILTLRRRLERWELPHLRALAAEQAERIEALETQLAQAQTSAEHASDDAAFWHDFAMQLQEEFWDAGGSTGITQAGALVILASPTAHGTA